MNTFLIIRTSSIDDSTSLDKINLLGFLKIFITIHLKREQVIIPVLFYFVFVLIINKEQSRLLKNCFWVLKHLTDNSTSSSNGTVNLGVLKVAFGHRKDLIYFRL